MSHLIYTYGFEEVSLLVQLLDHLCQAFYICINFYSYMICTDENNMKTIMWTVLLTTIRKKSITRLETTVRMGFTCQYTSVGIKPLELVSGWR